MATTDLAFRGSPPPDDLDDILGNLDDENVNATNGNTANGPQKPPPKDDALGLDQEITVVKQRRPIPKLDETLLLSDAGISKLRRISKDRLRLKGKGHEYGDIARMLNMYQLWLDDLYPRAKFADGLVMIEKLGHSKRTQYMRKEWINEGKPGYNAASDAEETVEQSVDNTVEQNNQQSANAETAPNAEAMEGVLHGDAAQNLRTSSNLDERPSHNMPQPTENLGDYPDDDDDLDALLAESEMTHNPIPKRTVSAGPPPEDDPFADDMEAMAELEGMW
ncbi:Swi3-domain-containing protein [Aaosphaeria arxii CBS 175.79]|uniref:Chromosome segregation in meiosis protein n=1 Tax=Aaosphaeria arxii CBS 175.79 TaxID=1450172 RepID=A0A6A5XTM9_9PLEO|nr:Swi3-domain-containing protein [Aaosphaeria arxii CBS 175.79]KAF2016266.1 Swi3-domain-containing protein [Aaosphaeria arxii CBS 175.79]